MVRHAFHLQATRSLGGRPRPLALAGCIAAVTARRPRRARGATAAVALPAWQCQRQRHWQAPPLAAAGTGSEQVRARAAAGPAASGKLAASGGPGPGPGEPGPAAVSPPRAIATAGPAVARRGTVTATVALSVVAGPSRPHVASCRWLDVGMGARGLDGRGARVCSLAKPASSSTWHRHLLGRCSPPAGRRRTGGGDSAAGVRIYCTSARRPSCSEPATGCHIVTACCCAPS